MQVLGLCSIVLRCQAGVFAEGMAYGLFVGQPLDSLVLRGVSMHLGVLSRHFMKDLSLQCAIGRLF
jgi:hypothetical protein